MNGFTFCNNKNLFTSNLQTSLITNSQKKKKREKKRIWNETRDQLS